MDGDSRDLLLESIRELLSHSADLVAGLDDLGWQDVVSEDPAAVDLLFTEQGKAGHGSAALDTVLIEAAGGDLRESSRTRRPAVVHPVAAATSIVCDERVLIDGVALSDLRTTQGCVVAADDAESSVYLLKPNQVMAEPVGGFDPGWSLHRVRIDASLADLEELKCDWTAAIAAARRALASELVGNASAMLEIAVDHVRQRVQFGRPVGANQTPRHRLAHCYARVAGARALIDTAWQSGTSWDAWVAKTYAGHASDLTGRACLQVCGAIGLTSEHALGGYVKRARILDALYGGWRASTQDIGMTLLRSETIPVGPRV